MTQTPTDALRLVPVEPTEAMVANALGTLTDYRGKGNGDYVSATHWMPLPAAPTGEPK